MGRHRARILRRRSSCARCCAGWPGCATSATTSLVVAADLNDAAQVSAAVDAAIERFGRIDLVVHGAGRVDPAAFALGRGHGPGRRRGAVLAEAARPAPPDRGDARARAAAAGSCTPRSRASSAVSAWPPTPARMRCSTPLAVAGGDGWLSIDWDAWDNAAEAHSVGDAESDLSAARARTRSCGCSGADVGSRALVVAGDLEGRLDAWVRHDRGGAGEEHRRRPPSATEPVDAVRGAAHRARRRRSPRSGACSWASTEVGIHDRFFDLGGHSLLAVQVASEIRDAFEIELPVLKLFQAPTVGELAVIDRPGVARARRMRRRRRCRRSRRRRRARATLDGRGARARRPRRATASSTTT